jgi:hypothetical protein
MQSTLDCMLNGHVHVNFSTKVLHCLHSWLLDVSCFFQLRTLFMSDATMDLLPLPSTLVVQN